MTVYFTGDSHYGHWTSSTRNIIKFCDRPFPNIGEHDEALIAERNRIVGPNDMVYDLGDFTLGGEATARRYFARLNGRVSILGNEFHHDKRWLSHGPYWTKHHEVTILPSIHTMKINDLFIVLCHYPFAVWDRAHYGSICLHAHTHGRYQGEGKILDVGVDSAARLLGAYRPFSLGEIIEYMEDRDG